MKNNPTTFRYKKLFTPTVCFVVTIFFAPSFLVGCGNDISNTPPPAESSNSPTGGEGEVTPTIRKESVESQNFSIKPGGTVFSVPKLWQPATVPGADVAFLVTTAPNLEAVAITRLEGSFPKGTLNSEDSTKLVDAVVEIIRKETPEIKLVEESFQAGNSGEYARLVLVEANKKVTTWVVNVQNELYLVTLGVPYSDGRNGVFSPNVGDGAENNGGGEGGFITLVGEDAETQIQSIIEGLIKTT